MVRKVKKSLRLVTLSVATVALLAGGSFVLSSNLKSLIPVSSYEAIRVFDGDTFETKEQQYIRISGIDAPEMGRCGSEQAKKKLESLLLGKKLYIKILYHRDSRLMGTVTTNEGSVGEQMLRSGMAIKMDKEAIHDPSMQIATNYARNKKLGIFSSLCTQSENPKNPTCAIKGNIVSGNQKTYHKPGCQSYSFTTVQLYNGDEWFCSEREAQSSGFTKAQSCEN